MTDSAQQVILVVDDEPIVLSLLETILTQAGYKVLTAANHTRALQFCRQQGKTISLALLDYMMMNEPEFVKCLKDLQPGLGIALMSGYTRRDLEDRGVPFERYSFLAKPFNPETLVTFVKASIAGENARGAG